MIAYYTTHKLFITANKLISVHVHNYVYTFIIVMVHAQYKNTLFMLLKVLLSYYSLTFIQCSTALRVWVCVSSHCIDKVLRISIFYVFPVGRYCIIYTYMYM